MSPTAAPTSTTRPSTTAATPKSGGSRLVAAVRYVLIMSLILFALLEVGVRFLTHPGPGGTLLFRNLALLPYRPEEAKVREALDKLRFDPLLQRDPDIGWTIRANKHDDANQTNAQGIRGTPGTRYPDQPGEGKLRIIAVGDSFTYCSEVNNGQTWEEYLERGRSDIEVLNMGLPGGGSDQAYLRWKRDGRPLHAHIVLLCIWPDNLFRNLGVVSYYRSQGDVAFCKPRLVRDGSEWKWVNAPIMSEAEYVAAVTHPEDAPLLRSDYWFHIEDTTPSLIRSFRLTGLLSSAWRRNQQRLTYQRLLTGEDHQAIDVTVEIARRFSEDVKAAGSIPLIVIIPDRERLALHTGPKPWVMVQALREAKLDVIDTGPTFGAEVQKAGPANYYVNGVGHHSPFGNQSFAQHLQRELSPWLEKAQALKPN
jgi:hypothetical protein